MKRRMLLLFLWPVLLSTMGWAETVTTTLSAPGAPRVYMTGSASSRATLRPCRYPRFEYSPQNNDPLCEYTLRMTNSLKPIVQVTPPSASPKPVTCPTRWEDVPDLTHVINFDSYNERALGFLMVTWSIRIQGQANPVLLGEGNPSVYRAVSPYSIICNSWEGTSVQSFPGGRSSLNNPSVQTRLVINTYQYGAVADLLLPDVGNGSETAELMIYGSVMISPLDFSGQFPESMDLRIQWRSDTAITVISPEDSRNMIVSFFPQGNQ